MIREDLFEPVLYHTYNLLNICIPPRACNLFCIKSSMILII